MSRFLQLHLLTAYPPSNPNRDDIGRPKSAMLGGHPRLRISSQALKRAIRDNADFREALAGSLGDRTQRLGETIAAHVTAKGGTEDQATEIARQVAAAFGKLKKSGDDNPTRIEQLAFISPDERALALELAEQIMAGEEPPTDKELAKRTLRKADGAADIAMFGRMLADSPDFNRDAAVQVAHAITTSRVEIEDDFYTAVDDLKTPAEDAGAGFIGEAGFGAGVFYLYICVDRALLLENLAGDAGLAAKALGAFVRAAATASPSGKKNSFANHVRAEFVLAELGDAQPLSLASAFVNPIGAGDQVVLSRDRMLELRKNFAAAYGKGWTDERVLDVRAGGSTLEELAEFAAAGVGELAE